VRSGTRVEGRAKVEGEKNMGNVNPISRKSELGKSKITGKEGLETRWQTRPSPRSGYIHIDLKSPSNPAVSSK
jgi:hypothetical protein